MLRVRHRPRARPSAPGSDSPVRPSLSPVRELCPALPLYVCREFPGGRHQKAGEELRQAQTVLAGATEDRKRAVEVEPVALGERFEVVDQTKKFYVVEHEPRVSPFTKFDEELPRRVEHPLYLGNVVATDELSWRWPVEVAEEL